MDSPKKISPWIGSALIAFCLSLIAAALMTGYECKVGTTDQCLMSKGLFPFYLGVLFLLLWPLVAAVGSAFSGSRKDSG